MSKRYPYAVFVPKATYGNDNMFVSAKYATLDEAIKATNILQKGHYQAFGRYMSLRIRVWNEQEKLFEPLNHEDHEYFVGMQIRVD